jgi:hypothetical protein
MIIIFRVFVTLIYFTKVLVRKKKGRGKPESLSDWGNPSRRHPSEPPPPDSSLRPEHVAHKEGESASTV